jgi:cytochrome c oxidase subunit 4
MNRTVRRLTSIWLGLLVLLALTCGSAFFPMGIWNTVTNFGIAVGKALLIAVFFMHLERGRTVYRLVAIAALYTLALLVTLSLADYSARERYPAPWQAPAALR